jgi:hypothetical protein
MPPTANLRLALSKDELVLVNNALNEILHGPDSIDEREFHARLGVERQRAVEFLARIGRLLDR